MNENKYPVVSSLRDPRFLSLLSLQTHQGRSCTKLFIIEGIRHLSRAVEHSAPIESIFLDPSVLSNPFGQKLARRLRQKSNGVLVVASSPSGLMDYKMLAYRFPAALIVGSEKHGLSDQLLETANFVVRIPMRGGCDSLNAAVAAGVLLFEMAGQRKEPL